MDEAVTQRLAAEALSVDVDGFEGPLDLLLALARTQKVDLREISVLALVEQYLAFVREAEGLRLELAADYLVMAAWLAYLKSRLLLPPEPGEDAPDAEALAAHLAFQLRRLEAMREAASRLMALDRLGLDRFARGAPEGEAREVRTVHSASVVDLARAYARLRTRDDFRPYVVDRTDLYTMEEALERLRRAIGATPEWTDLLRFLPEGWRAGPRGRSATAATFAASLELVRAGRAELRQDGRFAPLRLRAKP